MSEPSVSLPNLPPCLLTSTVVVPFSPSIVQSQCIPTLDSFSFSLSNACCGLMYSPSATEPTKPLTTLRTSSSCTFGRFDCLQQIYHQQ